MTRKRRIISTKLFKEFFESEKSGGLILIACTIISLVLANSIFSSEYIHFWHTNFAGQPLEYWINDGLMTIFFFADWAGIGTGSLSRRIIQYQKCTAAYFCGNWRNACSCGNLFIL